jgi:molecular chaperone HscA
MVLATRSALKADAGLLTSDERVDIESLIEVCINSKTETNAKHIEAVTKALAVGTEAFAAARMNAGIARALSGKNINSV